MSEKQQKAPSSQSNAYRRTFRLRPESTSKNCHFSKVTTPLCSQSNILPTLVDSDPKKWPIIYLAKLRACQMHMPDFTDAKKDTDMKDEKKECLIELIDVLDENEALDLISNEKLVQEAF